MTRRPRMRTTPPRRPSRFATSCKPLLGRPVRSPQFHRVFGRRAERTRRTGCGVRRHPRRCLSGRQRPGGCSRHGARRGRPQMPGNLWFDVLQVDGHANHFTLVEGWRDHASFDASLIDRLDPRLPAKTDPARRRPLRRAALPRAAVASPRPGRETPIPVPIISRIPAAVTNSSNGRVAAPGRGRPLISRRQRRRPAPAPRTGDPSWARPARGEARRGSSRRDG